MITQLKGLPGKRKIDSDTETEKNSDKMRKRTRNATEACDADSSSEENDDAISVSGRAPDFGTSTAIKTFYRNVCGYWDQNSLKHTTPTKPTSTIVFPSRSSRLKTRSNLHSIEQLRSRSTRFRFKILYLLVHSKKSSRKKG